MSLTCQSYDNPVFGDSVNANKKSYTSDRPELQISSAWQPPTDADFRDYGNAEEKVYPVQQVLRLPHDWRDWQMFDACEWHRPASPSRHSGHIRLVPPMRCPHCDCVIRWHEPYAELAISYFAAIIERESLR